MANFNSENDINSLLHIDAPLQRMPIARWQRKGLDSSVNNNGSFNISANVSVVKTPNANKSVNVSTASFSKTPSKTPRKTPGKSKKTPKKSKTPKTPNGGDRFIPNRSTTQFDLSHYKLVQENDDEDEQNLSPNKLERQKYLINTLHGCDVSNTRIISYSTKAPPAPEGFQSELRVLYSHGKTPSSCMRKSTRHIPQAPERILDAPEIYDDFYLNLLDWSSTNILAVSLAETVYLWKAATGEITALITLEEAGSYISSVSWIDDGNYLAVGTSTGQLQLWDVEHTRRVRVMAAHNTRIGALSWNQYVCTSGSRSGLIHHHDVRNANHLVGTLAGHVQEVCGLRWSPDGRYLASGGNDNVINIWSAVVNECFTDTNPLYTFSQHTSAVKALSWCPWQPSILASGGGTSDRCIRLWNCNTGVCLNATDTKSQVCSVLWSKEYKELISGHGYVNNQLTLWKYPAMAKVAELTGHSARVLDLAMSPDGTMVVSAAADETLRFWKCFAADPKKIKNEKKAKESADNVILRTRIR